MSKKPVVLILGATGLFGGLLAERLIRQARFDVVCAGRTEQKLKQFCERAGGRYRVIDRESPDQVETVLKELNPFAVVDCAGPFQYYGDDPYRFARQVIEAKCHYLDIADASGFVAGFGVVDELAKANGVTAISGASSTPAISAAVADELVGGLTKVISVESTIIPGNRTKRGLSVFKAVLGQIGQKYTIRRHGVREQIRGWLETVSVDLDVPGKAQVRHRLASQVNTPDVVLFPERYRAETVTFRAGLEIRAFHYCLILGKLLVASGLFKSLVGFSGFARWFASLFETIGSDLGGMKVAVLGETRDGTYVHRVWDLIADDGHGPEIPTLPVSVLLEKLLQGEVATGGRASPGEVTIGEVEHALAEIGAATQTRTQTIQPLFRKVLGDEFDKLPTPVKELHSGFGRSIYEGRATAEGPTGLLGRMAAPLVGFHAGGDDIPVRVTIDADLNGETWSREFDGKKFQSGLTVDEGGFAQERFGPLAARLGLHVKEGKLHYPVLSGRLFGWLPFPSFLLPQSISHEEVDDQGRFVFDVLVKFRFGGRIAHYRGWLVRRDP